MPTLKVKFLGKEFINPYILSASPCTDELEYIEEAFELGWAGAVTKTTSFEGNPVPLKYPMISGYDFNYHRLNAMGNIDLISKYHIDVVEKRIKYLKKKWGSKRVVIGSLMGADKKSWQSVVKRLIDAGADMIECSFSCPQGSMGAEPGKMLAQSPEATEKVTGWVKEAAGKVPVLIKITPHVTDIVEIARRVKNGGGDGITASNTIQSLMGVDIENFVPIPNVAGKSTYSGMSGPAIKPITLKVIADIKINTGIPIAGTGGCSDWRDAVEFMAVGAGIVQLCTAPMHYGFRIIDDLTSGLFYYLERMNFNSPMDIIDRALANITTHDELPLIEPKSHISEELCIRCDLCYIACYDGGHRAIELRPNDRFPHVDEEKCVGCGLCKTVCPVVDCIEIKVPEKAKRRK